MKLYRTDNGILLENGGRYYSFPESNWDELINQPDLLETLQGVVGQLREEPGDSSVLLQPFAIPMVSQELWASGVTYLRSKQGRQAESADSGGADFYQKVYEAERPELFFKATAARVAAHGEPIRIRADSTWDVPEPELVLVINKRAEIIGYTIGNDVSSRSIEGENPLYLPQAKVYDGCAALGPCILLSNEALDPATLIHLFIERDGATIFSDSIAINRITRRFEDLVGWLFRECSFPHGALLMTGTGIVPDNDFTLRRGDLVSISIDGIGTLTNPVA